MTDLHNNSQYSLDFYNIVANQLLACKLLSWGLSYTNILCRSCTYVDGSGYAHDLELQNVDAPQTEPLCKAQRSTDLNFFVSMGFEVIPR